MTNKWSTEQVLAVSSSFQECRIILSAAELDLFSKLKKRPKTSEELAAAENWSNRGLTILMDALTAMGLLSKDSHGRYRLESSLAPLLTRDGDDSILPLVLHRVTMWKS